MSEDLGMLDLVQRKIAELIQKVPANDEDARKRAELLISMMHLALAHAHMACASNKQDQSEAFFNLAEEAGREAFSVEECHAARYTEDVMPYKLALGSILSASKGQYVRLGLIEVLCRVQEIDPDVMRSIYRDWQEGKQVTCSAYTR